MKFDPSQPVAVAERIAGPNAGCADVTKLPEGNFNKVFLAKMADGLELILKLPNPKCWCSHYTTASEVATTEYVCIGHQDPAYFHQRLDTNFAAAYTRA